MKDDVPDEVKQRRLREVISLFHSTVAMCSERMIGSEQLLLVKGVGALSLSLSLSLSHSSPPPPSLSLSLLSFLRGASAQVMSWLV